MVEMYSNFSHTQAEQTGQKTYYCDSVEDIATLPRDGKSAAVGSTAIVVTTDCPTYMLSPSLVWVKIN